ncbi:MAG: fused response regulator/phosphatase, partial [bacterium]
MNKTAQPLTAPSSLPDESARRSRILIMDDELPNRAVLRKLLSAQGHEVLEAADGAIGLELASRCAPDLALVDVMMPGISGYEVCQLLRNTPATSMIPVILVTARRAVEDVERGLDLGAFDYIRKPFNARELLARVRNALALKRGADEMRLWREQMTRELDLAGSLQRKLFPAHPLFVGNFAVDVAYQPSLTVGGDVFDIVALPGDWLCVYVGDVCGHGVASALVSALLKAVIAEVIPDSFRDGPAAVCRAVDARFRRQVSNPAIYATLFMAIFDPVRSVWTCMNCGHPDPFLIVDSGGDVSGTLAGGGDLPIGFASPKPTRYEPSGETQAPAPPGSTLVLLTDGILEATHRTTHEPYGAGRLKEVVLETLSRRRYITLARRVLDVIRGEDYELNHDDCSLLLVERQ